VHHPHPGPVPPPANPPPPPPTATRTYVTVPHLVGLGLYDAEARLTRHGLSTANVVPDRMGRGVAGTVIRTDPPAGSSVPSGTQVNLYVAVPP
jgi:beta-lactam-binding protein with PASTA domain